MRADVILRRAIAWIGVVLLVAGCATAPPRPHIALPPLQLTPASLGGTLALQQRLTFEFGAERRELDALLEADADSVRLAVQAMGRSGVTLAWDGTTLQQQRAEWLPAAVRGERVLDDLQFVHWPLAAIAAALPAGWSVDERDGARSLRHGMRAWLVATRPSSDTVLLENRADGYRLQVQSAPRGAP